MLGRTECDNSVHWFLEFLPALQAKLGPVAQMPRIRARPFHLLPAERDSDAPHAVFLDGLDDRRAPAAADV